MAKKGKRKRPEAAGGGGRFDSLVGLAVIVLFAAVAGGLFGFFMPGFAESGSVDLRDAMDHDQALTDRWDTAWLRVVIGAVVGGICGFLFDLLLRKDRFTREQLKDACDSNLRYRGPGGRSR